MLFAAICLLTGLVAASPASRVVPRQASQTTANLVFSAGPVSYSMAVPADGKVYPTNHNNLSVSIITDNDYNAFYQCKFYLAGEATLAPSIDITTGGQFIAVGPPQPITGVSCSGSCVPVFSKCYDNNNQMLGTCCNGYCAATLCRPWNDI